MKSHSEFLISNKKTRFEDKHIISKKDKAALSTLIDSIRFDYTYPVSVDMTIGEKKEEEDDRKNII